MCPAGAVEKAVLAGRSHAVIIPAGFTHADEMVIPRCFSLKVASIMPLPAGILKEQVPSAFLVMAILLPLESLTVRLTGS